MSWSGTTRRLGVLVAAALLGGAGGSALAITGDRPTGGIPMMPSSHRLPADSIMVAPDGRDSGAGTLDDPMATLRGAIDRAPAGGTIVLREGRYHESVTIPENKPLTVKSHPREEVWLDGTVAVRGWTRDGDIWRHDGWTAEFDSTPAYTPGARPSGDEDFRFVDPAHPMAAHPDQVWIDGKRQRQVGSRSEVTAGTFYVDHRADRLYLGSDPSGRRVRASDLGEAVTIRAPGSVLRGIGVHGYATGVPQLGTVKVIGDGSRVRNVTVSGSATTGLSALGRDISITNVITKHNGMLGLHANYADGLRIDRLKSLRNNLERFKSAPVAGGVKVTRSRGVTVTGSQLRGNLGTGLWMDESVHNMTIVGNDVDENAGHGVSLELSAKAVIADNLVRDNAKDGIRVNNTSGVRVWNNTVRGGTRGLNIVQDDRRADDLSTSGHDPRQELPDPTVTWVIKDLSAGNNIIADPAPGATCLLCVEDYSHERSAGEMGIHADGNVYVNRSSAAPRWRFVWSRGPGDPAVYTSVEEFRKTGRERHGLVLESDAGRVGGLPGEAAPRAAKAARPIPGDVLTAFGGDRRPDQVGARR